MESAVRGAWVEPAIVTARLERRFSSQNRRSFGLPNGIGRRNPAAGNGIFGCRDGRPKSAGETASVTRDRRTERYRRKSPQKRPVLSRPGNLQFGRTGWWARQGSNL